MTTQAMTALPKTRPAQRGIVVRRALENLLLRLSRLAEDVEEIDEIDLNPVFALEPGSGCRIADARIHVRPKSDSHHSGRTS